MDEYFCTNCGAILNHQSGFDPSYGTWTCTECGAELMDDDIYEGDTYEGVAWYCDECGALLNRQEGFSDSYESWTCTECGHTNGTTEDDIYDSKDDYERQQEKDNALICPNCGENLTDQFCFDEYSDDWTCTECGAHLHHDYSDDPYIIVDDDQDDDDDEEHDSFSRPSSRSNSTAHSTVSSQPKKVKRSFSKKLKRLLFRIPITYAPDELIGLNYKDVVARLEDAGFTYIRAMGTEDLELSAIAEENNVYEISVSGETTFDSRAKFSHNIEIIVKYHKLKRIPMPFSSKETARMNYLDVISAFRDAGFFNICTVAEYDVIVGWITKDGEVEAVTIGGKGKFNVGTKARPDVEIIVTYHTYRRNKM